MAASNPDKYPMRLGQPWRDEEIQRLLQSVQKKKSLHEIATEHGRTIGGIRSRLRSLAADYHFNDGRPMHEIQKFTGLSEADILDAIKKRMPNESSKPTVVHVKSTEPTLRDVVELLKDIQAKLVDLTEKVVYVHS